MGAGAGAVVGAATRGLGLAHDMLRAMSCTQLDQLIGLLAFLLVELGVTLTLTLALFGYMGRG